MLYTLVGISTNEFIKNKFCIYFGRNSKNGLVYAKK